MKHPKTFTWFSALVLLAGCPGLEPESKRQLATVTVTCTPASLPTGGTAQCDAIAKDQDGVEFDLDGFWWKSSNPEVAAVDGRGKVTAQSMPGTAVISARADVGTTMSMQAETTVTVIRRDPTVHTGNVTANETWRAAENPHVVRGVIDVDGANLPTLTIEEGAVIRFEQDAALRIYNGTLKAMGTEQAPIRMVSSESSPTKGFWRGLELGSEGNDTELNHVTLSHCGRASIPGEEACILIHGQGKPVLRHVTVQDSATAGVVVSFDNISNFGDGSTVLSVTGSEGYAISTLANQADKIPTGGTFTGAVELVGMVSRTQTWPSLGIPYVLKQSLNVGAASGTPTLTLSPGTELRFGADAELRVGDYTIGPGALIADGTAEAPIRFVPDQTPPTPGYWRGLHLQQASGSKLNHVTISHGGSNNTSNLIVYGELGAFLTNSTISDSTTCGLYRDRTVTTDFTAPEFNNTFANNALGGQCAD